MEFCERLQYLREHYTRPPKPRYITADLMGLDRQVLYRLERGEQEPRLDQLIKIAAYYGVTLDYLGYGDR